MDGDDLSAKAIRKYKMHKAIKEGNEEDFKKAYTQPKPTVPKKKASDGLVKALPSVLTNVSDMLAKKARKGMKKQC